MNLSRTPRTSRILKNSRTSLGIAALIGASFALHSSTAAACGGLFCSAANPVNQAAERIIFSQNEDDTITAAIEILYEGPAERFAWVLPVPAGEIRVGVSSKDAFDALDNATNPQYNLQRQFDESCPPQPPTAFAAPTAEAPVEAPSDGAVQVIASGNTGPYVWEQIMVDAGQADPAQVAIDWLEANGYDVGALGPDVLRPYLQAGNNLVAFRLDKDSDAGSIRPVMITYPGQDPSVPIVPTAIAANEDMGIKVWVLGPSRAIPENYFHLELNEANINWFNPNSNYNEVVTAAANEAGGQGFVTEHSGPAAAFSMQMYTPVMQNFWDRLQNGQFETTQEFLEMAIGSLGRLDGFSDVLSDPAVFPLREGATVEQFRNCVSCYFETDVPVRNGAYPSTDFDPETDPLLAMDVQAFLAEVDELVITPLADTAALFESNNSVTRFYTTMSPDEMVTDPFFNFNPELEDVSNIHTAIQTMQCSEDEPAWRIELSQGIILKGDGTQWPITLQDNTLPMNFRILQMGTAGPGDTTMNNAAVIRDLLSDLGIGEAGPALEEAARAAEMNPPVPSMEPDPTVEPEPQMVDGNTGMPVMEDPETGNMVIMDPETGEMAMGSDGEPIEVDPGNIIEMTPGGEMTEGGASAGGGGCSIQPANGSGNSSLPWLGLAGLGLVLARRKRR